MREKEAFHAEKMAAMEHRLWLFSSSGVKGLGDSDNSNRAAGLVKKKKTDKDSDGYELQSILLSSGDSDVNRSGDSDSNSTSDKSDINDDPADREQGDAGELTDTAPGRFRRRYLKRVARLSGALRAAKLAQDKAELRCIELEEQLRDQIDWNEGIAKEVGGLVLHLQFICIQYVTQ